MDCVAIGDSIAVGVGQAARCSIEAKVGASSAYIARNTSTTGATVAVISAGSNDPHSPSLKKNLINIRAKVSADRVVWILPYDRKAAAVVRAVSRMYDDAYIDLAGYRTNDGVHPRSYSSVAKSLGD